MHAGTRFTQICPGFVMPKETTTTEPSARAALRAPLAWAAVNRTCP